MPARVEELSLPHLLDALDADVGPGPGLIADLTRRAATTGGLVSVQPWHRTEPVDEQLSAPFNLVTMMGAGTAAPAWSQPSPAAPSVRSWPRPGQLPDVPGRAASAARGLEQEHGVLVGTPTAVADPRHRPVGDGGAAGCHGALEAGAWAVIGVVTGRHT